MKTMTLVLGTSAMLALTASLAGAQDRHEEPGKKAEKKTEAATAQGSVTAVDPKTHELRPATPEEMQTLHGSRAAARRGSGSKEANTGLRAIHHHTGAEGIVLDESYMTSMVAVVGKDGKVSYQCVDGVKDGSKKAPAGGLQAKKDGAADVK